MNTADTALELPADTYAERTILGALLNDASRLGDVSGMLAPSDYSLDSHQKIFDAMFELAREFNSVDLVTLSHQLSRRGQLQAVGGVAYLASLTEGLPRRPEIDDYIRIVKEKALCREMLRVSAGLSARAY